MFLSLWLFSIILLSEFRVGAVELARVHKVRSGKNVGTSVEYVVKAFGKEYVMDFQPNLDLLPTGFAAHFR